MYAGLKAGALHQYFFLQNLLIKPNEHESPR